jgi:hypothetical protein
LLCVNNSSHTAAIICESFGGILAPGLNDMT